MNEKYSVTIKKEKCLLLVVILSFLRVVRTRTRTRANNITIVIVIGRSSSRRSRGNSGLGAGELLESRAAELSIAVDAL